jgi:hypothetical protein
MKDGAVAVRDAVSPEEWQARVELAACYRLMPLYGMSDLSTTTSPPACRALKTAS